MGTASKITDQERAFCQNLVQGMAIAEAARRAGYADSTADKVAPLWIGKTKLNSRKPHLFDYIQELREKAESEAIASLKETLILLTDILRSDISNIIDFDGTTAKLKPFQEAGNITRIVKRLKFQTGKSLNIELYSKMNAARELMKYHGAYTQKVESPNEKKLAEINYDYSSLTLEEKRNLRKLLRKASVNNQ